jgi:pimeloyl-ACP methyl ester carboxylesterase
VRSPSNTRFIGSLVADEDAAIAFVMAETKVIELPDGREFAWLELGDPHGPAVFVFHGSPGSRVQVSCDPEAIAASGVRFIAPDRPGYGHSSFHRGRTLRDWPDDVRALADHLGIASFSVIGVSGGGPHAAVCAALLADRVRTAGIVSGVGPLVDPELAGAMVGINRGVTAMAVRAPFVLRPIFEAQTFVCRRWPERALRAGAKQMPEADARALQRPEVRAAFLQESRQASATSAAAATQDFALFGRDWGFRLEEIAVPVHIWHGDEDKNVRYIHGKYFAQRIPGAQFHACPGEGHLLVVDHLAEILTTVAAAR